MEDLRSTGTSGGGRMRSWLVLAVICIVAIASFATGYRAGVARQERRLLNEFLVNAARLGILDLDRLRELAGGGTNAPEGALHDFEAREGD